VATIRKQTATFDTRLVTGRLTKSTEKRVCFYVKSEGGLSVLGTVLVLSGSVLIGGGIILVVKAFATSSREAEASPVLEPSLARELVPTGQSGAIAQPKQPSVIEPAAVPAPTNETATPDNKEKGNLFEEYVVGKMPKPTFVLIDWRSDKSSQGTYPESNRYPDIKMRFHDPKSGRWKFALECKYRSELAEVVVWCRPDQLKFYQQYEKQSKIPVFVVIGLGGTPDCPEFVSIFPLSEVSGTKLLKAECVAHKRANTALDFVYDPLSGQLS
jgi:hypothetical protein